MRARRSIAVLGGGLSGMAAAYSLAKAGAGDVTLIERGSALGGLAGTFERDGHFYPLAYHHINGIDRPLLFFLDAIGALDRVRWRKIRMLFQVDGRLYDLARPIDFWRFPMGLVDKLRFVRLMLSAFARSDWRDWNERSAAELVDQWAGPGVRRAIFEPLCQLKFKLPCNEVSGAWMGARLHHREGSAPLGYIPGANWTQVLCDGIGRLLADAGVHVRTGTTVTRLQVSEQQVTEIELNGTERIECDTVVSSMPTGVYRQLLPDDRTSYLASIRYTAVVSLICTARLPADLDFYWLNLASLKCTASAIFMLNALNPTIGAPGESCINFVTHLQSATDPFFRRSDDELLAGYIKDFHDVFGIALEPNWVHLARIPIYSPILVPGYRNPPIRSETYRNVYFAGNYRTFPSLVSTGTAISSGLEAAQAILQASGESTDLIAAARSFRMSRASRRAA